MKRSSRTIPILAAILFSFGRELTAQSLEARVLAKDGQGPITRASLALTLRARAGCDATRDLIPDESRLVSDDLTTLVDEKGRGVFRGSGAIVAPDGQAVLQVIIHGIIGLPAATSADCVAPGHLEATLDPVPTFRADTAILDARLSADLIPELAGPLPIYRARLDGLVTPAPELAAVAIAPERPAYELDEPILALVKNGSSSAIEAFDGESYCTIVRLERQVRDGWELTAGCPLARMPLPTKIGAGETLRLLLPPEPAKPATKEPGVYRLAVSYLPLSATSVVGPRGIAVSAPFKVGPSTPAVDTLLVVTDKSGYRSGEPIVAKVVNGSDQTFETYDHRSFCSFLTLRRLGAAGWTEVAPCPLASPTLPVRIAPRSSVVVTLPSGRVATEVAAGFYRLELEGYFLDAGGKPLEPAVRAESKLFVVLAVRSSGSGDRD